jgi:hypothetical protein
MPIFAIDTEKRRLHVFDSAGVAVRYCEGVDVENGVWRFWDNAGQPLAPEFIKASLQGLGVMRSGTYRLVKDVSAKEPELLQMLGQITSVEGPAPLNTVDGVRRHLTPGGTDGP